MQIEIEVSLRPSKHLPAGTKIELEFSLRFKNHYILSTQYHAKISDNIIVSWYCYTVTFTNTICQVSDFEEHVEVVDKETVLVREYYHQPSFSKLNSCINHKFSYFMPLKTCVVQPALEKNNLLNFLYLKKKLSK